MTTEQIKELRERILQGLKDREPHVHDATISTVVDDETGDESTAVDLTLADPPKGSESWELSLLDDLALTVERIVAREDLPPAVINVVPASHEEYEDESVTR